MKLAANLHREGVLYVLDEPTTGLHLSDIERELCGVEGSHTADHLRAALANR